MDKSSSQNRMLFSISMATFKADFQQKIINYLWRFFVENRHGWCHGTYWIMTTSSEMQMGLPLSLPHCIFWIIRINHSNDVKSCLPILYIINKNISSPYLITTSKCIRATLFRDFVITFSHTQIDMKYLVEIQKLY